MGETGSITRGWKEEESCTREWFCVLGLGKPRPKTQNHPLVQDSSSFHPLVMEPLYPEEEKKILLLEVPSVHFTCNGAICTAPHIYIATRPTLWWESTGTWSWDPTLWSAKWVEREGILHEWFYSQHYSRVQYSSSSHPRVMEPVSPTIKRRNIHVLPWS